MIFWDEMRWDEKERRIIIHIIELLALSFTLRGVKFHLFSFPFFSYYNCKFQRNKKEKFWPELFLLFILLLFWLICWVCVCVCFAFLRINEWMIGPLLISYLRIQFNLIDRFPFIFLFAFFHFIIHHPAIAIAIDIAIANFV